MHYNIQISVQEVEESTPAEQDQYGKVKRPAKERRVTEVYKLALTGPTMQDVVERAGKHLTIAVGD